MKVLLAFTGAWVGALVLLIGVWSMLIHPLLAHITHALATLP